MFHAIARHVHLLGVFWVGLLLLIGWRLWRREWRRAIAPALLAAFLYAFGATPLTAYLFAGLERPYAGVEVASLPRADAIVMLGGQLRASRHDPLGIDVADASDRALTVMELLRRGTASTVILGGGGPRPGRPGPAESDLVKDWLIRWGFTNATLLTLGNCRNTRDEALRTKALIEERRWQRIVLVTSAPHMKRAEAVFRAVGVNVTPVACDFEGLSALESSDPKFAVVPQLGGLRELDYYVHEQIGWWVYKLRGWVD